MNEQQPPYKALLPVGVRIKDAKWGKEGVVIAHTSKGEKVIEWDNGSVGVFDGKYNIIHKSCIPDNLLDPQNETP